MLFYWLSSFDKGKEEIFLFLLQKLVICWTVFIWEDLVASFWFLRLRHPFRVLSCKPSLGSFTFYAIIIFSLFLKPVFLPLLLIIFNYQIKSPMALLIYMLHCILHLLHSLGISAIIIIPKNVSKKIFFVILGKVYKL